MPLTDTQIRKLKPTLQCTPARPDKYSDTNNLRLWVRHTGNKVWVSDYSFNGKRKSTPIGKYPAMSLQQAREANHAIKELIANGIDPATHKRKYTAIADGINQFSTLAEQWHTKRKASIKQNTYQRDYSQYERDIKPFLGNMDITEITPPQILMIGKRIEERGAGDMARRAIRQVGQIFLHALRMGIVKYDPTVGLTADLKPRTIIHHARLPYEALPKLLADIDSYGGNLLVKLGLEFLCYTFVRTTEIRFMTWQEIDYNARLWRIPADRMKMSRPHIVPLSPQAVAILDQIKALNFSDTYVFFNTTTHKPYSENAFLTALWRMGYKGRMTGHGFRGLASTKLHELQYDHKAIELQLAHDSDSKVSKAYNGAELLPYRVQMLNDWAVLIDEAKAGKIDNVIHFTPAKQGKAVNK